MYFDTEQMQSGGHKNKIFVFGILACRDRLVRTPTVIVCKHFFLLQFINFYHI